MSVFSLSSAVKKTAAVMGLAGMMLFTRGYILPIDTAQAYETHTVYNADGSALFELHFFDSGECYEEGTSEDPPGISTWTLNRQEKNAVISAIQILTDIVGPASRNRTPVVINIGTYDIMNAEASSDPDSSEESIFFTGLQSAIINGSSLHTPALILVGPLDNAVPDHLFPLPTTGKTDLVAVLYHETAHALGIGSNMMPGPQRPLTIWDTHLVDINGTALKPGINIVAANDENRQEGDFIVGDFADSGVTFHGEHVAEVLGSDKGLPVEGCEYVYDEHGSPVLLFDLSHIELEHSLMSHQSYRNYVSLMEAELAALQDIGYTLDRKNFFGFSVYGDDTEITNSNGYFARNKEGTAYLAGTPNMTTLGVGLHIYGKRNSVTQTADLLACGTAGTGIRMDGSGNTLIVAPGVRVAADGSWGTGILVAYGKDQTVISRGDVQALGYGGIAARFDFGNNILGNDTEYRGSWIWTNTYGGSLQTNSSSDNRILDENGFELNLDGPLVSTFNVSGLLSGSAASIFISENALVKNINILSGSSVHGDIISRWDPNNPDIQYDEQARDELHTALTFGLASDAEGNAGAEDNSFDMTLHGSIDGEKSLDMTVEAGHLAVTGTIDVYSLHNSGHLSLYGMNASGNAAEVATSFVNNANAVLETGFNASGAVNGIQADTATLGGTWALRPMPDFYAEDALITPKHPVEASTVNSHFSSIMLADNDSPTLNFALTNSSTSPSVVVSRDDNAYSRYAANAGAQSLGHALYGIAGEAEGDMQRLLAALDWSGRSGSGVTRGLNVLGPEAYDVSARTSLSQMNEFTTLLLRHMLAGKAEKSSPLSSGSSEPDAWEIRISPYGSGTWQGSRNGYTGWHSTAAGLLAEADRQVAPGLTLGGHLAAGARRTALHGNIAAAETRSLFLGTQAMFSPDTWNGCYLTAQARMGVENGEMDRQTTFNGYAGHTTSDWNAFAGSVMVGAGKDWSWKFDKGTFRAGPLLWLTYDVLHRPSLSEQGSQASCLHLDTETYTSVPLALGAHAGWHTRLRNGTGVDLDILAAWQHELADTSFHTAAHFRDYQDFGFFSSTDTEGRDAMLIQSSLRLAGNDTPFFMQLDLGGELFRDDHTGVNAALSLGWKF